MSLKIIGPILTNPQLSSTGYDDSIHRMYYELIRGIEKDATARFAFYMWNYDNGNYSEYNPKYITDTLAERGRNEQGLDVKILLDVDYYSDDSSSPKYADYKAYQVLFDAFGDKVRLVNKEKMGQGAEAGFAMHLKMITISEASFDDDCVVEELRGKKNVKYIVMVSSANIWGDQQYQWSNDAIIFHGNEELYNEALSYWEHINTEATSSTPITKFTPTGRADTVIEKVKWYNFPREADDDVSAAVIKNMKTAMETPDSEEARFWGTETKTRARLIMAIFTNTRIAIAKRLGLVDDFYHCDVKAILRGDNESKDNYETNYLPVIQELESHGIPIAFSPNPEDSEIKIHNKILTFQGRYPIDGKTKYRKLVWTGSQSFTGEALKENAETWIRIENEDMYVAYKEYFDTLYEATEKGVDAATVVSVVVAVIVVVIFIITLF